MPLMMIKMPPNILQVFKGFNDIINMKLVDSKVVYAWLQETYLTLSLKSDNSTMIRPNVTDTANSTTRLLNMTESAESPEEAAAKILSIDKDNLIADLILGCIALFVVLLLIIAVLLLIKYHYRKLPEILKKLIQTIKAKLMWSSILRYMTQSYLDQSILCTMSLSYFYDLSIVQKVITPLTLVYLVILPGFLAYVLYMNREHLRKPEMKMQIGTLYMNYETDKKSVYHFTMLFLYRRLAFALTIVFMKVSVVL